MPNFNIDFESAEMLRRLADISERTARQQLQYLIKLAYYRRLDDAANGVTIPGEEDAVYLRSLR